MDLQLAEKRAIITGGSRGLGRAIARNLLLEGASVVIASRTESEIVRTADELGKETKRRPHPLVLDVLNPESIKSCVKSAAEVLGGIDILVNCAARTGGHGEEADIYASASEKGMLLDFEEKVVGSLRLVRAAEPFMKQNDWGRIVLISGGAGRVRGGLISAGARNRAINNLAVGLANALGPFGIGVVSIAPGSAVTERQMDAHRRAAAQAGVPLEKYVADRAMKTTLLRRLMTAEDLAKSATFLCSPVSWAINAANIEMSGGSSPDIHYELSPHPPWEPGTAI